MKIIKNENKKSKFNCGRERRLKYGLIDPSLSLPLNLKLFLSLPCLSLLFPFSFSLSLKALFVPYRLTFLAFSSSTHRQKGNKEVPILSSARQTATAADSNYIIFPPLFLLIQVALLLASQNPRLAIYIRCQSSFSVDLWTSFRLRVDLVIRR